MFDIIFILLPTADESLIVVWIINYRVMNIELVYVRKFRIFATKHAHILNQIIRININS